MHCQCMFTHRLISNYVIEKKIICLLLTEKKYLKCLNNLVGHENSFNKLTVLHHYIKVSFNFPEMLTSLVKCSKLSKLLLMKASFQKPNFPWNVCGSNSCVERYQEGKNMYRKSFPFLLPTCSNPRKTTDKQSLEKCFRVVFPLPLKAY